MKQTDYLIRVRRNSDNALLAEVTNYARLDAISRFNDVGRWTLEIGEETAASAFLTSKTNGIVLERNVHDGNGFKPFLSGPIDHIERSGGSAHNLLISGPDDNHKLKDRLALNNPTYPIYATLINSFSPLRYYRLGESSGTTATDSASAHNGTYNGGVTLAQSALIDDPNTSALFNGTSGYMSAASTGLPTGVNAACARITWFKFAANPAAQQWITGVGDRHLAGKLIGLQLNTNGTVQISNATLNVVGLAALALNVPHCAIWVFDGSKLYLYLDGVLQNSGGTSASLTLAYSGTAPYTIAAQTSGSGGEVPANFFGGTVDEDVFIGSAPTAAQALQVYQTGLSRYGYQYSDHQSGAAETVLKHYVNVNAGPGARPEFQVANLTIEADSALGSTVSADARNEVLLDKLKEIAVAGGDLGFRVVQVGSNLEFQVYQPPDVSSNAKFSEQLGNLADFAYSIDAPKANYVLGGGQGEGTARAFYEQADSASIADWGRTIVAFYDDRGATDLATLQNDVAAQLDQDKEATTFQAQPIDTDALQALRDYDLGSKVSVIVNGSAVTDLIREVEITITPNNGAVIKPGIGTVGSGQIEAIITAYQQELKKLRTLVQRLQAHK